MSPRTDDAPKPDPIARREEMEARARRIRRAGALGTIAAVGVFTGLAAASHAGSSGSGDEAKASTPAPDAARWSGDDEDGDDERGIIEKVVGGALGGAVDGVIRYGEDQGFLERSSDGSSVGPSVDLGGILGSSGGS